ncbi:uncharacterized protein LOC106718461 [Papilio machaon]|uniref:uncharacterized protein LOC106718461 n=1 Tax=Papilio machaon TaxID=76193 RepID=UPI001E665B3F|nr:uncharacterized protein LOC106718461 [Papilio machaon]
MKFSCSIFFVVLLNCHRESVTLPIKGRKEFKLPKPLTSDTAITINGTMITKNNLLTVTLAEKGGSHICELRYNTSAKLISMRQSKDPTVNTETYEVSESIRPVKFVLHIEPRFYSEYSINFELNINDSGPLPIQCLSGNFETVNKIIVKGAESISSLLFQYKD